MHKIDIAIDLLIFMVDVLSTEKRSKVMSKIRGKNTTPELLVRRELWKRGFRYRIHDRSLPGTPDISNKSRKLAVFIDGCFWHACPLHYRKSKSNTLFWDAKIRRNKERRNEVRKELSEMGFIVLEFYECEVKEDVGRVVSSISRYLE